MKGISLAMGETARIAASDFATSNGTRFNPITTKPKDVHLLPRYKRWLQINGGLLGVSCISCLTAGCRSDARPRFANGRSA